LCGRRVVVELTLVETERCLACSGFRHRVINSADCVVVGEESKV
jgi:hypothetical protein